MHETGQRPLSPHLQIYRLPLTAKISILHRATGALLFIGTLLISVILIIAASGSEHWQSLHSILSSVPGKLLLLGLTFALYFHLCSGIRHLLWDIGKGFSPQATNRSNALIIIGSSILTLLTWFIAWSLNT